MKQLIPPANITFNAAAKTITFASTIPASLAHILHVTNVTRGVMYFQPQAGASYSGTYASPVLTLAASTTGHSNGDVLEVFYDDGTNLGVISGLSAVGSAPALNPVSVSGVDGGGLKRHLLTDTAGRLATLSLDGVGNAITSTLINSKQRLDVTLAGGHGANAAVNGFGDMVGGSDGTNFRYLSVDSTGKANVNAVQPLVLSTPTSNTLTAAGQVQYQIVPGGVYTLCISSASTLGSTANTMSSCTTTIGSTTVAYTGTAPQVGQLLAGTGISPGSYVVSTNAGTNFVMSLPATAAGTVTLNVTAGFFAGTFQTSSDNISWSNVSVVPMTYAVNSAATSSFVAPGLFRYASSPTDKYIRFNLTSIGTTGVLGNLSSGPTVRFNVDALDRNGGVINLPYVQYTAATASTFPTGIPVVMPVDTSGLSEIVIDHNTFTGTSPVVTTRQTNDDTGTLFQGLVLISTTSVAPAPALTYTAGGNYRVAPTAKYFYASATGGTAISASSLGGVVARIGVHPSEQNVSMLSGNITQLNGSALQTGGATGVFAVGGKDAHSSATTTNPTTTGGRVVPTTVATTELTLAAGDAAWTPISTGYQVIQKQFGTSELDWSAVTSLTPTVWASAATLTQVRAASGTASVRTYVSSLQVATDALGGATSLWLLDGAVSISSSTVATPGVFTSGTHDFKVGDAVVLQNIATLAITGVSANQVVYVATVPSTTTFTLALTPGGTGVQVTASGTATIYRILKQVRLQTTALPVTTIPLPSPIRTAPNVALSLLCSATQTGTVYADTQGYYGF